MDSKKLSRSLMLGRGAILTPHIDAYLERQEFPEEWVIKIRTKKEARDYGEAKIRFSAGEDALLDPLTLYKKIRGETVPHKISASLQRTFDCGSMWHDYMEQIVVEMGFTKPEDVERYAIQKIETDHGIAYGSGKGDLVNVEIPGHGSWLVDLKTMKKSDFESEPPKYLWDKYVAQVNLYGNWFGQKKLMILGIEKDSPHRLREWVIPYDPELVRGIYDRWTYTMSCLELGTEPIPDP